MPGTTESELHTNSNADFFNVIGQQQSSSLSGFVPNEDTLGEIVLAYRCLVGVAIAEPIQTQTITPENAKISVCAVSFESGRSTPVAWISPRQRTFGFPAPLATTRWLSTARRARSQ